MFPIAGTNTLANIANTQSDYPEDPAAIEAPRLLVFH